MKFSFTDHPAFVTLARNRGGVPWSANFEVSVRLPNATWPDGSWSKHDRGFEPAERWIAAPTPELLETRCLEFLRAHDDAVKSAAAYKDKVLSSMADKLRRAGWTTGMSLEWTRSVAKTVEIDGKTYATPAALKKNPEPYCPGAWRCQGCGVDGQGQVAYAFGLGYFHRQCLPAPTTEERT